MFFTANSGAPITNVPYFSKETALNLRELENAICVFERMRLPVPKRSCKAF